MDNEEKTENWSTNPIPHYCEITIDDTLPMLMVVTFQNGMPIGKLYLTVTCTWFPG